MDGSIIGAVIALVITVFSILFSIVVTLVALFVPMAVMGAGVWFFLQAQKQGPRAVALAPAGPLRVKRGACPGCGAPKVRRSTFAYVYCDFCGELYDFDFQACLADKRSRLPGPAYEGLVRGFQPELDRLRGLDDRAGYQAVQERIFKAYADACPAALSPRIGDPDYKARYAHHAAACQTAAEFDPEAKAAFAAQQQAVGLLTWDRSNPLSPRARPETFWPMIDAVFASQYAAQAAHTSAGVINQHPDHASPEVQLRIGLSLLVQGWLPFVSGEDGQKLIERADLKDEYVEVEPAPTHSGPCPCCGAPLEVVEGAKRVLCPACGHLAGVGNGTVRCHGCGAPATLPEGSSLFKCGSCEAELRLMRWS